MGFIGASGINGSIGDQGLKGPGVNLKLCQYYEAPKVGESSVTNLVVDRTIQNVSWQ